MNIVISDKSLRSDTDNGFVLDFGAEMKRLSPNHGADYVLPARLSLVGDSRAWQKPSPRDRFAAPVSIGSFSMADGLEGVKFGQYIIKAIGKNHAALPSSLAFLLPVVDRACRDALNLYGEERFTRSSVTLAARHQIVAPETAQRPEAGGWHDHREDGERHKPDVDLIYCFTTAMSTEFLAKDGTVKAAAPGSLARFGAEAVHRSPVNDTASPLTRLWGVVVTHPYARPTNQETAPLAYAVPGSDRFLAAVARARASLQNNIMRFTPHEAIPILGLAA